MAANIINRDIQVGLEMAWHGQTKIVERIAFEDAFPYEIERTPLLLANDTPWVVGEDGEGSGWSYFKCSDDGRPAGKPVADTYNAITNARFWEIVNNAVGGSGAVVESAGTLFDRARRFISVKLGTDVDDFQVGDRVFKNRLSLLDSIDGSTNLYGVNTSTCVVCSNTFAVAMNDSTGEFRFKIRHSKNMTDKIENMEKAIDVFVGVTAQFKAALEIANEVPVQTEDARALFAGWAANDSGISTRTYNTVGRLTDLFSGGLGNGGETLLDAVSAVTDYYSHESSGGKDAANFKMKQTMSSEFGAASRKKQDFFYTLFTPDRKDRKVVTFNKEGFNRTVEQGKRVLAAADVVMAGK